MNKQAEHYEKTGDMLKGAEAEKAYRAAQNHLQPSDNNYMVDAKRLQDKIIASIQEVS